MLGFQETLPDDAFVLNVMHRLARERRRRRLILFVFGLFLFSMHMRPLLWQVTMFTIAHTITLGLAMTGYLDIPERIVQPLIALSIAWIGIENVFLPHLSRHRLVIVFGFGLLHGIGFADALAEHEAAILAELENQTFAYAENPA